MHPFLFTFHYVYIYMKFPTLVVLPYWDLHSTMFIFILVKSGNKTSLLLFTFHYVYIYMISSVITYSLYMKFTFHYVYIYIKEYLVTKNLLTHLHSTMFIFIWRTQKRHMVYTVIYIPLCLYLYVSGIIMTTIPYLHLHSTMFIFIFYGAAFSRSIESYLHSTMFIFISIPDIPEEYQKNLFTFHYVYIYMKWLQNLY